MMSCGASCVFGSFRERRDRHVDDTVLDERPVGATMSQAAQQLDDVLDQLVRNIEASVHAFYRGDHRKNTVQTKSDQHRKAARDALLPLLVNGAVSGAPRAGATLGQLGGGTSGNAAMLAPDEIAAITRCIMGWLPMGVPTDASP